jgi:hypothetical protein
MAAVPAVPPSRPMAGQRQGLVAMARGHGLNRTMSRMRPRRRRRGGGRGKDPSWRCCGTPSTKPCSPQPRPAPREGYGCLAAVAFYGSPYMSQYPGRQSSIAFGVRSRGQKAAPSQCHPPPARHRALASPPSPRPPACLSRRRYVSYRIVSHRIAPYRIISPDAHMAMSSPQQGLSASHAVT